MAESNTVVVFSPIEDVHALVVARELETLDVNLLHLDTADFPEDADLEVSIARSATELRFRLGSYEFCHGDVSGVWLRRPSPHKLAPSIVQRDAHVFATQSTRATLWGGVHAFCDNVMNPYGASEEARFKPLQLAIARQAGLAVPKTLFTQDAERITSFRKNLSAYGLQTVYKPVTTWHYGLRETRLLKDEDIADLETSPPHCPTIFQEFIEGPADLRITVVGNEVFPALIHISEGRSPVDGRLDRVPIEPYQLNDVLKGRILKMQRKLGLAYGAYDFRLRENGEAVFMEVNPEGQYLFVEIKTGLKISRAVASRLAGRSALSNSPVGVRR